MISILEVVDAESGARREVLRHSGRIEAPNWSPCGAWLLVNGAGRLWRVPLAAPALIPVESGAADRCNNDHGFTQDGRIVLGSHHEGQGAQIYAIPDSGGQPERISSAPPSWWHGLSPDGKVMVYAGVRNDLRRVDIFARTLAGGPERQLTEGAAHDDGPDFSHDGTRIYWNSDRSGAAQIWVMAADGSDQRRLFADDRVNWFPHPSPCGRWLVWISYPPGTEGHPADLPVRVMISDPDGAEARILAEITGGQGSLNVPCWSPDGAAFAMIRYDPAEVSGTDALGR